MLKRVQQINAILLLRQKRLNSTTTKFYHGETLKQGLERGNWTLLWLLSSRNDYSALWACNLYLSCDAPRLTWLLKVRRKQYYSFVTFWERRELSKMQSYSLFSTLFLSYVLLSSSARNWILKLKRLKRKVSHITLAPWHVHHVMHATYYPGRHQANMNSCLGLVRPH